MVNTVGIRFPNSGKTYCFKAKDMELITGDRVVVESELGISIGSIAKPAFKTDTPEDKLRPVLRKVTAADLKQEEENAGVLGEASSYCKERIKGRELPMKLITTDVTLDRKRFIFYFTADSRIDFRELVKDLASKFRSRIELRQIGVRDAAKMAGGYGVCGKEVCCKTWLRSFAPISIKMAKQQDLILNTCKLSGLCGRLLCCLNYEYEEGAPRRKRQKRREPAEVAAKKEAALDTALAEAVKAPVEQKAAQGAQDKPARPAQPARTDGGDSTERRHFKKGRRSRRSRATQKARGTSEDAGNIASTEAEGATARQEQGAKDTAEPKPKSKRRSRRRGRRRKPRNPAGNPEGSGGQDNKGGQGGQGGQGSPANQGPTPSRPDGPQDKK
ncbi:MAG: hypothetical protein KAR83_03270 [Thermodesulfovibrionales bacterium]|nr:hypothetical protein [Thermodesulfovibrionales bacterium]